MEGTYRFLKAFPAQSEVDRWLVKQLLKYLDEEGFSPMEQMRKQHTDALAISREANTVLEALVAGAERQIDQVWGVNTSLKSGGKGKNFWKHYPPKPRYIEALPGGSWMEFKVTGGVNFGSPDGPKDDVVFIAGLSWKAQGFAGPTEGLLARLLGQDFLEFKEGSCDRLMRVSTPENFLNTESGEDVSLEEQGAALGDWVIDALEVTCRELGQTDEPSHPRA